jgi:hypothetical protein
MRGIEGSTLIEFICGIFIGWIITYLWMQGKDQSPRQFETVIALKKASMYYLSEFGPLEEYKKMGLANRIARGVPLRVNGIHGIVGGGKLLTRNEWDKVVIGGMLAHGRLERKRDKTLIPTPFFRETCQELIYAHARTSTHERTRQ